MKLFSSVSIAALLTLVLGTLAIQTAFAQATTTDDVVVVDTTSVEVISTDTDAGSSTIAQLLQTLQTLMARVRELQAQLAQVRGEIRDVLSDGLREGVSGDDVRDIQQLLATDPTIYPEGYTTGYFGPLTREAIKRFQKRHGLEETGEIDKYTKELLEEYFEEKDDAGFPPGLLRDNGIVKKIEKRVCKKHDKEESDHPLAEICSMMDDDMFDDMMDDDMMGNMMDDDMDSADEVDSRDDDLGDEVDSEDEMDESDDTDKDKDHDDDSADDDMMDDDMMGGAGGMM